MHSKLYISGSWDERAKIHEIIKQFGEIAEITHDWTIHESEELLANPVYLKCQAMLSMDGIERADYLIIILNNKPLSQSNWVEIGLAIGTDIPILIFNESNVVLNNLYVNHSSIKMFDDLNKIAEYIKD
jgi:hypothetical protein